MVLNEFRLPKGVQPSFGRRAGHFLLGHTAVVPQLFQFTVHPRHNVGNETVHLLAFYPQTQDTQLRRWTFEFENQVLICKDDGRPVRLTGARTFFGERFHPTQGTWLQLVSFEILLLRGDGAAFGASDFNC